MPLLLNLLPARFLLTLREWFDYKISHCVLFPPPALPDHPSHPIPGDKLQQRKRKSSFSVSGYFMLESDPKLKKDQYISKFKKSDNVRMIMHENETLHKKKISHRTKYIIVDCTIICIRAIIAYFILSTSSFLKQWKQNCMLSQFNCIVFFSIGFHNCLLYLLMI